MLCLKILCWLINYSIAAASSGPMRLGGLYVHSFGRSQDPAIIYAHGGPSYDSQDFEITTAQALADRGYFVVVYDQRGQGRSSVAPNSNVYRYSVYANDIKFLINHLDLKHPTLLADSHGGLISIKFDQIYPGTASRIILSSAPINFWLAVEAVEENCGRRLESSPELARFKAQFSVLRSKASTRDEEIDAVGEIFRRAVRAPCHLYRTPTSTEESQRLGEKIARERVEVAEKNILLPMAGFMTHERYVYLDESSWVAANAQHIYGIYGADDGLFTADALKSIERSLEINPSEYRLQIISGASHGPYLDQQTKYLNAVDRVMKDKQH